MSFYYAAQLISASKKANCLEFVKLIYLGTKSLHRMGLKVSFFQRNINLMLLMNSRELTISKLFGFTGKVLNSLSYFEIL